MVSGGTDTPKKSGLSDIDTHGREAPCNQSRWSPCPPRAAVANNCGRLRSLADSRHRRPQVIELTGHGRATAETTQADTADSFPSPPPSNLDSRSGNCVEVACGAG